MSIGAIMIEMTKTSAVVFIKARKSLIVWWREKKIIWEDGEKMYFLKLHYRLTWKLVRGVREELVYCGNSTKWTSWKGNNMLVKVDYMCSLLKKSSRQWSFISTWRKRGIIKPIACFCPSISIRFLSKIQII